MDIKNYYNHTFKLGLLLVSSLTAAPSTAWEDAYPPPSTHGSSPYTVESNWLRPFAEPGFVWGSQPGIYVESSDRIFIIQRGELRIPEPKPDDFTNFYGSSGELNALRPPRGGRAMRNVIFTVNNHGEVQEIWRQWDYLFADTAGPHKIAINPYDPEHKVWVVNDARHQIHAFSNDGAKLMMSLGTWNEAGEDETHLGRPQDIAFFRDGSIVVADGLDNSRVVKFDSSGKFIKAWGTKGSADGQFDVVHAVAIDNQNRIYVADRNNDRIQVFDEEGKHLATWPGLNFPNHIVITDNQDVWVADNQPVRMIKFNTKGERLYSWDLQGRGEGQFDELHQFSIDSQGNWYGADNLLGRSLKFTPKSAVDLNRLLTAPKE